MKRTFFIGGIIVFIIILSLYYYRYFVLNNANKYPFQAIPTTASFVFACQDLKEFNNKLNSTAFSSQIDSIPFLRSMKEKSVLLNKFLANNKHLYQSLNKGKLLIAFHRTSADAFDLIYAFQANKNDFTDLFKEELNKSYKIDLLTDNGTTIYKISFDNTDRSFFCTYTKSIFILSFTDFLVKDAVSQLNKPVSWLTGQYFVKSKDLAGVGFDGALYVNYQTIGLFLSTFSNADNINAIKKLAQWSGLDMLIKNKGMLMTGYTLCNDSIPQHLSLLNQQTPKECQVVNILPANTTFLFWVGFSNYALFYDQQFELYPQDDTLFREYFLPWIEEELAFITQETNGHKDSLIIVHAQDIITAKNLLNVLSHSAELTYKDFPIWQIKNNSALLSNLFLTIFGKITQPYYTIIDDYVIFSSRLFAIKRFAESYTLGRFLGKQINYLSFSDNISSEANLYIYINNRNADKLITPFIAGQLKDSVAAYDNILRKFDQMAIQFSNYKKAFYTTFFLSYDDKEADKTKLLWEHVLDAPPIIPPQFVHNHYTYEYDVIVQDEQNQLYLLNNKGKLLWKKKIDDRILGKIHQIDFYKNRKLQFLFNTGDKVYLIDRNGNDVEEDFALSLKSSAYAPLTLLNYDNSKQYRYFIACEDSNLYGYYKTGKLLPGWESKSNLGILVFPLQHFSIDGKDYLLVANNKGSVYIFNRKGELRVPKIELNTMIKHPFIADTKTEMPRFITTDTSGIVYMVSLDGQIEKKNFGKYSSDHFFDYQDIAGDDAEEYVFVDKAKLFVFGQDGVLLYDKEFEEVIKVPPVFLKIDKTDKKYKIGIVESKSCKIYLFNDAGLLYNDFPMHGTTAFKISNASKGHNTNLLVGGEKNSIYLYALKSDLY